MAKTEKGHENGVIVKRTVCHSSNMHTAILNNVYCSN